MGVDIKESSTRASLQVSDTFVACLIHYCFLFWYGKVGEYTKDGRSAFFFFSFFSFAPLTPYVVFEYVLQ